MIEIDGKSEGEGREVREGLLDVDVMNFVSLSYILTSRSFQPISSSGMTRLIISKR